MRVQRAAAVLLAALSAACGPERTRTVRPQLVPPEATADFGPVPVLNEKKLDIPLLNVGRATLAVLTATLQETGVPFRVFQVPESVGAGETRPVSVVFVPPAEVGYEATLVVESDDPESPFVEVKLTGQGSTRAVMELEPVELDFGRVAEGTSVVKSFTIRSRGTADLFIDSLTFSEGTSAAYSFVGSTKTPAVVKAVGANGLPGELLMSVRDTQAPAAPAAGLGSVRIQGTDPDRPEVEVLLKGDVNRAPIAAISPLGNGAPGLTIELDGTGSSDPDGDLPLAFSWKLRSAPIGSTTKILGTSQARTSMVLDPALPGEYEVELNVTDAAGAKNLAPARVKIVATPAEKLLIEMFWNNNDPDLDLHVLRSTTAPLGAVPDDCYYLNPRPDWGAVGDLTDDPSFLRDALKGYGPEVLGYVNPPDGTYRIAVEYVNEHLSASPSTEVTVRVYEFGVVKGELKKTLQKKGEVWRVADVDWPSGAITPL